jgi:hypothetical protein
MLIAFSTSRCHLYYCLSLDCYCELISELKVNNLRDSMVSTRDGSADAEAAQPDGHSSPPPTLAHVFASIHESRIEQTELLRLLVNNSSCGDTAVSNARDQVRSTYVEFLSTQPPTFAEASEPLEADHWLHTIESKFELLHCTENQKMLLAAARQCQTMVGQLHRHSSR